MRLLIFLLIILFSSTYASDYKNEVIIMYKNGSISTASSDKKITKQKVPEGKTLEQFIEELKKREDVLYVEPNYILKALALPNDPDFYDSNGNPQWWWSVINAPDAWDITTGSKTVYIAVVDTGVDYTHPDLKGNLWVNTGELLNTDNNSNGIDDGCENSDDKDGNGYVDDCYGINALCYEYDQNGKPVYNKTLLGCNRPDAYDDDGHGTHVAGIIGAVTNNGEGVAGVNWNIKIIPCKFLDGSGNGSLEGEILCLDYINKLKTQKGLNIIALNASYGGKYTASDIEKTKISSLSDILFITAAGNEGENNETINFYPCNYDLDNQICVGASDETNNRVLFTANLASNYGINKVKIFAPGREILSTYLGNQYMNISGTSQAAPFVTGAVGLLYSKDSSLTVSQIKEKIMYSGKNHPDKLSGYSYTCNVLNLYNLFITDTEEKLCLDKVSYNFGDTVVGSSKTATFTVRNTGEVPLNISSVSSNSSNFSVSENCIGSQIQKNNTCTIDISFSPSSVNYYIGTVTINYGNNKILNIKVEGNGVSSTTTQTTFPDIKGSGGCKLSYYNDFGYVGAYILLIVSLIWRRFKRKNG
ncbi:S8 family serine peptidase [Persephonella sp.]